MDTRKVLLYGFQAVDVQSAMTGVEVPRALATTLGGALYVAATAVDANNNAVSLALANGTRLATLSSSRALLVSDPGNWSIENSPAVNTQATVSRAADAAAAHVCTGFSFTLNAVAAITVPLVVNLLDGATVLWSGRFTAPAGTTFAFERTGLSIIGTVNTAMTLAFAAAPGATNFANVSLQGYTTA